MGTLYLVRHGQASFGADDYDQLSPLGRQQAVRLGEYLRPKLQEKPLETVLMGSLKRHRQTWEGIAEGAGLPHTPSVWPGLNEYDSHALIESIHPEPLAKPDTPELYRHHFRLLRDALQAWMAGRTQPRDMGRVLGTPPETTIELNLRIRNTALTEFVFNPKRHMLLTYNTLPHLDSDAHKDWVTFA